MNKQRIIIFEGHDMVGKTEIATELGKRLNIKKYKNNKEQSRWQDKLVSLMYGMDEIVQLLEQVGFDIIIDRFHGSEFAYSKVFNRFTSKEKIADIDERLAKMDCLIVYCFKDSKAYLEDDQDIVRVDQYDKLKVAYEHFLTETKCEYIRLNTTDENLDKQVKTIIAALEAK